MYQVKRKRKGALTTDVSSAFVNSPVDLTPCIFLLVPTSTVFQGREDIGHSICHGFDTELIKGDWRLPDTKTRERAPRKRPQLPELGVLRDSLEIPNDIRSAEVDLQRFQLEAIDGNRKEASDSCEADVFETRVVSEEKRLQPRQGHCGVGKIDVVKLEGALALATFVAAAGP